MKILLLSDSYSEHTEKWALGLANSGIEVGLFSFNKSSYEWYNHKNITVFFEPDRKINAEKTLTKIAYLKYVTVLKKIIRHFQPDILRNELWICWCFKRFSSIHHIFLGHRCDEISQ
jgi:L-malate glycosyltransferase